jgi:N-methylhydantoinase B
VEQGLRLPPVKLFKRGEMDAEIYAIITSTSACRPAHRRHPCLAAALKVGERDLFD